MRSWRWVLSTGIYLDDALTEDMEEIKRTVRNMRYDGGTGYFWVNDDRWSGDPLAPTPTMVVHPIWPELEGKALDSEETQAFAKKMMSLENGFKTAKYLDANCEPREKATTEVHLQNLFVAAIERTMDRDSACIEYEWPKPSDVDTEGKPAPKSKRRT